MIGVFDSGVGGLSVWRELYAIMPDTDYIYVSDAAYCPYGLKPLDKIIERTDAITRFLIKRGAGIVVVACNTATAAAIKYLRSTFSIPFVGIEPAIKPAAITSKSGVVGILATANTFKGSLYHNTLERFASDIEVIEKVGNGLVELVERGETSGAEVETLLHKYIDPMLKRGADTIVLGCTHYPFLEDTIRKIAGASVKIVNPAPAVALQTQRIVLSLPPDHKEKCADFFFSTGDVAPLSAMVRAISPNMGNAVFKNIIL